MVGNPAREITKKKGSNPDEKNKKINDGF